MGALIGAIRQEEAKVHLDLPALLKVCALVSPLGSCMHCLLSKGINLDTLNPKCFPRSEPADKLGGLVAKAKKAGVSICATSCSGKSWQHMHVGRLNFQCPFYQSRTFGRCWQRYRTLQMRKTSLSVRTCQLSWPLLVPWVWLIMLREFGACLHVFQAPHVCICPLQAVRKLQGACACAARDCRKCSARG